MDLSVGDAVTVIGGKNTDFYSTHGLVVSIDEDDHPDGTVRVNFSEKHEDLLDFRGRGGYNSKSSMRFHPEDLEKNSQLDWTDQVYRKYPPSKGWSHTALRGRDTPLTNETICQCKGCTKKAVIRGFVNIHGCFYSVDFCPDHEKKHNGHGMDSLPFD